MKALTGYWIIAGVTIGGVLGSLMGNVIAGIGAGIAIGIAMAVALYARPKTPPAEDHPAKPDEPPPKTL